MNLPSVTQEGSMYGKIVVSVAPGMPAAHLLVDKAQLHTATTRKTLFDGISEPVIQIARLHTIDGPLANPPL